MKYVHIKTNTFHDAVLSNKRFQILRLKSSLFLKLGRGEHTGEGQDLSTSLQLETNLPSSTQKTR